MDRRYFLKAAGVSLALPSLESLGAETAIRRTVAINIPLGFYGPDFFPEGSGLGYKTSPYLERLDGMRDQFTVFSGLSHPGVDGGHAAEKSFLTAAPHPASRTFRNTVSVDQVMADAVGDQTRFASLTLGDRSLTHSANGVATPAVRSPSSVYSQLFLNGSREELSRRRIELSEGHSILDSVLEDARSMSGKVSARDRDKLDQFFTAVRETEGQLEKAGQWLDQPKPAVADPSPREVGSGDLLTWFEGHLEVVRLALATDSTRVIALSGANHGLVPPLPGVSMGYHGLSHHGKNPAMIDQLKVIDRGTIEVFGRFLEKLNSTSEGDGSLLDNTQVLLGSNLGNANAHFTDNLPVLLAGGSYAHAGHLQFSRGNNEPLCNLFVTMLQWMGLEHDHFGSSSGTQKGFPA
ncbi:MAG: DUF1552 domain-containing protein [Verrucomicrobiota bacterium]